MGLVGERNALEHGASPPQPLAITEAALRRDEQILPGRELLKDRRGLILHRDAESRDAESVEAGYLPAAQKDAAATQPQAPGQKLEERRFSRSVRSDDATQFAGAHFEVEIDREQAAERLREPADRQEHLGARHRRHRFACAQATCSEKKTATAGKSKSQPIQGRRSKTASSGGVMPCF